MRMGRGTRFWTSPGGRSAEPKRAPLKDDDPPAVRPRRGCGPGLVDVCRCRLLLRCQAAGQMSRADSGPWGSKKHGVGSGERGPRPASPSWRRCRARCRSPPPGMRDTSPTVSDTVQNYASLKRRSRRGTYVWPALSACVRVEELPQSASNGSTATTASVLRGP